jgi:hypothetical protein
MVLAVSSVVTTSVSSVVTIIIESVKPENFKNSLTLGGAEIIQFAIPSVVRTHPFQRMN